jgi:hypothetical protein
MSQTCESGCSAGVLSIAGCAAGDPSERRLVISGVFAPIAPKTARTSGLARRLTPEGPQQGAPQVRWRKSDRDAGAERRRRYRRESAHTSAIAAMVPPLVSKTTYRGGRRSATKMRPRAAAPAGRAGGRTRAAGLSADPRYRRGRSRPGRMQASFVASCKSAFDASELVIRPHGIYLAHSAIAKTAAGVIFAMVTSVVPGAGPARAPGAGPGTSAPGEGGRGCEAAENGQSDDVSHRSFSFAVES